ncbi:ferric reductase-like transmembrane domain-containing protein [Saccharothrix deserti]|uniref:ferric reductase-like transmembrane domain-containing protein n=1 Tax=Saccharothrix deserti TaxID=2593674 RepID=UPI001EE3CD1D|nr:ferric reductase-like transmembrane domain-containing protein [Saccharothrix deserti]
MVLAVSEHDSGVWDVATLSGRMAYVTMCLTACWGVLTATGWVRKITGRAALRITHQVLATFAVATAVVHAVTFLLLENGSLAIYQLVLPLVGGGEMRHALGVIGLELMIAAAVTASLQRTVFYRNWLRLHRLAYIGVWLGAMHAWLGAAANGHVSLVWIGGITVLMPAVTLTMLRFLPAHVLARLGVIEAAPTRVDDRRRPVTDDQPPAEDDRPVDGAPTGLRVAVDHGRCRHFALCQVQAPRVFRMLDDGRLRYARNPDADQAPQVHAAARACPMRAINVNASDVNTRDEIRVPETSGPKHRRSTIDLDR